MPGPFLAIETAVYTAVFALLKSCFMHGPYRSLLFVICWVLYGSEICCVARQDSMRHDKIRD